MITNTKTKIEVPSGCSTPDEYKRIVEAAKKLFGSPKKSVKPKRETSRDATMRNRIGG